MIRTRAYDAAKQLRILNPQWQSLGRVSLLPHEFTLSTTLKLQQALGRNLDGSERMGIAGSAGVMAYPLRELSGSDAQLLRVEQSHPLPAVGGVQHQWSVLANWGQARETGLQISRTLSDVAVGYLAKHGDGWLMKAYLAHRLEDQAAASEPTPRDKSWIQVGSTF